MQYFTLYDIKARGFVRPFCFGYVSKDHVKIDKNVSKFAAEFDKVHPLIIPMIHEHFEAVSATNFFSILLTDNKHFETHQSSVVLLWNAKILGQVKNG